MEEVFIDIRKENSWIRELFFDKDFVSISDLINEIEDLLGDIDRLKDEKKDLEEKLYGEIL